MKNKQEKGERHFLRTENVEIPSLTKGKVGKFVDWDDD